MSAMIFGDQVENLRGSRSSPHVRTTKASSRECPEFRMPRSSSASVKKLVGLVDHERRLRRLDRAEDRRSARYSTPGARAGPRRRGARASESCRTLLRRMDVQDRRNPAEVERVRMDDPQGEQVRAAVREDQVREEVADELGEERFAGDRVDRGAGSSKTSAVPWPAVSASPSRRLSATAWSSVPTRTPSSFARLLADPVIFERRQVGELGDRATRSGETVACRPSACFNATAT